MQLNNCYWEVFDEAPILGMIHLAGDEPVKRALEEIAIFEEEGLDGAIIENYHGSIGEVIKTLQEVSKLILNLVIGINILPNKFDQAFILAHKYRADFIQLDQVAGSYISGKLDFELYKSFKERYSDIIILGGVWPKYYQPVNGSDLETDVRNGMERAEAIVVTGSGTGIETPLEKINKFRNILGNHPLVVGAGLTVDNAYEQLCIADGAIVGTSFKIDSSTYNPIDQRNVKEFMSVAREARKYQNSIK